MMRLRYISDVVGLRTVWVVELLDEERELVRWCCIFSTHITDWVPWCGHKTVRTEGYRRVGDMQIFKGVIQKIV